MPGFIGDAVGIAGRIGEAEAVGGSVRGEPAEGGGAREIFVERRIFGRAEVERTARVVFAAAGRGDDAQDGIERFAGGEFGANERGLARDAAKTGERKQRKVFARGGGAQAVPGGGGGRRQANGAAVVVVRDGDERGLVGFGVKRERAGDEIIGGKAEISPKGGERSGWSVYSRHGSGMGWLPKVNPAARRPRTRSIPAQRYTGCPRQPPCSASQRSASIAEAQPMPAAVMA